MQITASKITYIVLGSAVIGTLIFFIVKSRSKPSLKIIKKSANQIEFSFDGNKSFIKPNQQLLVPGRNEMNVVASSDNTGASFKIYKLDTLIDTKTVYFA